MWNIFTFNDKDTRTTSLLYFKPFGSVSIVDFEQSFFSDKEFAE